MHIKWVFASTCYAFGVLKRNFNSPIDKELIAIIKSKLDDEPGFHADTLDFGNNHFQDQLERVVVETWDKFLSSDSRLNFSIHTQQKENQSNDDNDCSQQDNNPSATYDTSTASAIEQNKATPNSSNGGDSASNEHMFNEAQVRKVYLGGLSDDIDEPDLREYFKEFGTIADINIVLHKDTGKRRGFAFIEYEEHEPVDKIVSKKFHNIKGRRIEAKKAIPKVEMDARKRNDQRVSLTDTVMVLRGGGPAYLWDGLAATYGASSAHLHAQPPLAPPPTSSYHLDHHHHYPHHYHAAHYGGGGGPASWLMHAGGSGSRGSNANGYANQASNGNWATNFPTLTASDYGRLPVEAVAAAAAAGGGIGPVRTLGYGQYGRSCRPYPSGGGTGGGQRARGFK